MSDFLDLLETIRAEEASYQRLFGDVGRSVRQTSPTPQYLARLAEAAEFVERCYGKRNGAQRLREAMTTADFPLLFGDILDRQLLGGYQESPVSWPAYCRRAQVPDFRTVKRFAVDGGEGVLTAVAEQTDYPPVELSEATSYSYAVSKRGRVLKFSWEAIIDDDLGAFSETPARLGRAARRSEEKFVTQQFVDSSGPHASLYTAGNANIINTTNGAASPNPALSIAGLQDALTVLGNLKDADSEPIIVTSAVLVVCPALEVTGRNLLKAGQIWTRTSGGGTTAQELLVENWMQGFMTLAVNPYIPIVATTNGNTSWFVFASPSVGRPALELGFLRGHEAPEIFIKESNQRRIGGAINPLDGDFDSDSVEYKVRHCFGGARGDGKATVASNGSGS